MEYVEQGGKHYYGQMPVWRKQINDSLQQEKWR